MPERGICATEARAFSGVDEFLALLAPKTPRGRDRLESFPLSASRAELESRLDDIEAALSFARRNAKDRARLDRIAWHMRRIVRLPFAPTAGENGTGASEPRGESGLDEGKPQVLDLAGLFAVKKFMANYRAVVRLVDEETARRFDLVFVSEELARALSEGGSDEESLYIADSRDAALGEARRRIRDADTKLSALRARSVADALERHGLDFSGAEYVIVLQSAAHGIFDERDVFSISVYDDSRWKISLRPAPGELELEVEREALAAEEAEAEDRVIAGLWAAATAEAVHLSRYEAALARFDVAMACAALVDGQGLVRPRFVGKERILYSLRGGRFAPCERTCIALGSEYTPLDLELVQNAAVIFGSNMGGKTVALQSALFFQILAQLGLFVPAVSFETRLYRYIQYVGELPGPSSRGCVEGLSGFGFEIRSLCDAWREARTREPDGARGEGDALLAFDEFARTTSSLEAEALISAALETFSREPGVLSLFSTHFSGVERLPGARYLRVPGLDRSAARAALDSDTALGERIRMINGLMRHGLVDDSGEASGGSDAVAIASLLGLDEVITARARELYAHGTAVEKHDI